MRILCEGHCDLDKVREMLMPRKQFDLSPGDTESEEVQARPRLGHHQLLLQLNRWNPTFRRFLSSCPQEKPYCLLQPKVGQDRNWVHQQPRARLALPDPPHQRSGNALRSAAATPQLHRECNGHKFTRDNDKDETFCKRRSIRIDFPFLFRGSADLTANAMSAPR